MNSAVINPAQFPRRANFNTRLPVRIARLVACDREQLLGLLCRLCADDRRNRFMACVTEPALAAYVASIDFSCTSSFGSWTEDGTLVAVVEGFVYSVSGQRCIEAAFATDPAWRRLGLAKQLYRALADDAASTGVHRIIASCGARNRAMRELLRATDAVTVNGPGEVFASWSFPRPTAEPCLVHLAVEPTHSNSTVLSFARSVEVTESQTARRLFATLPHGAAYAHRLIPAMATGLLVATIESVCILELQSHLSDEETVVGTDIDVRHVAPALPGRALRITGSGRHVGSKTHFDVVVDGDNRRLATARVVLAIVDEKRFASRLAGMAG